MDRDDREIDVPGWRVPAGTRALVAEDDIVSSTLLAYVLRAHGCDVNMAPNGEEAVSRSESQPYDLVFLDLLLPGITGLEAAHEIRLRRQAQGDTNVKIVGMSTLPLDEVWKSCSAAGMDAFLAKPIQKDDVLRLLQHLFAAAPPAASVADDAVAALDVHAFLQRLSGDTAFAKEMAKGFLDRCPAMLVEIRDALWRVDREQLALAAHRLSGSAAEFGAHRVLAVTHELERLGRNGDMRRAGKLLPTLEEAVAQMKAALTTIRDQHESS